MMVTRLKLTAVLGLTAGFAACAQGEVNGTGGVSTTTSSSSAATSTSQASSSGVGSGGAPATTSSTTASVSSSASGGNGGTGGMSLCGNGMLDPGEQCDGTDFGTATCTSRGLGPGTLVCNTFCHIVVSGCTPLEDCTNGVDDNGDGLVDCRDP